LNGFEIQIHSTQYFFSDNNHKETAYIGIAIFEEKLTNEQLQYMHQCKYTCSIFMVLNMEFLKLDYIMNKFAGPKQIHQIAKQWNINDFDFFMDLIVSILSMCLIEIYIYLSL